jgi:hypothetical protein
MPLPTLIPAQTVPLSAANAAGQQIVDMNWYLFLYNMWKNTIGTSGGEVPFPPTVAIALTEIDVDAADIPHVYQQIANTQLLQPEADSSPTQREIVNAQILADPLLQDPQPAAQPVAAITVGASPFTYTAPFDGCVIVSGGIVSAVAIARQGTSVATGITAGIVPVRRLDNVTITYTVLPTATFLPT